MVSKTLLFVSVLVVGTLTSTAQSFRGKYVVIAREIMLPADSTGAPQRLTYGDTVSVVARPSAEMFQIRVGEQRWVVRQDGLIRAAEFDRNIVDTLESNNGQPVPVALPANAFERLHTFRVGVGVGPCIPLQSEIDADVGLAMSVQAEVLIDRVNTHITFGYHSVAMAYRNSFGDSAEINVGYVSMGALYSFGSIPKKLTPYVSLLVAISTEYNNQFMIAPGLGLDWYVTPNAVLFSEIQPTYHFQSSEFVWMPVKFGMRLAL